MQIGEIGRVTAGVGIWSSGQISNNTIVNNEIGVLVMADPTSIVGNSIGYNSSFGIRSFAGDQFFSYGNNQLLGNNETLPPSLPGNQVGGGVQMGPNICDGVACP